MGTRIFGIRNTYSVAEAAGGQWQLAPAEVGRRLFGPVASGSQATGVMLRNGGRLDLAVASRPAYATPDCHGAADLAVYDKAGERILEGLLADAGQGPGDGGGTGAVAVLKTGIGPAGGSYGCQEDYLVARRGEFGRLADVLIPFLVTRQLIGGAGSVTQTPHGALYCLGRPAERTGTGPPAARLPFLTTRDEPRHAAAGLRRLRVTVSDPGMSETTALLKAGATDLVLGMAEAAAVLPDLTLDHSVQAIGEVSRDITGRRRVRLADGRQLSALDIQREYLARAKDFTDRRGTDPAGQRVLGLWQRALDAIGAGDLDAIAREIDWAIKYRLIERYRAAHDLPLSAPQVAQADLAYHDISRSRGLYYQLQRGGAAVRAARDIDIFEAKTAPPPPGRYRQTG